MDWDSVVAGLSDIEKKSLKALAPGEKMDAAALAKASGVNIDSARRAMQWLHEKGLVQLEEKMVLKHRLTEKGKQAVTEGLPERKLVDAFKEKNALPIEKLRAALGEEFNIAFGLAKKLNWISPGKEVTFNRELFEDGRKRFEEKEAALKEAESDLGKAFAEEFFSRGLVNKSALKERVACINEEGKKALQHKAFAAARKWVVDAPAPPVHIGKRQPYVQFLNQVRRRLVALGFKEMETPLVTQEFYNFDVLFQPQNHPARAWTDTYQFRDVKKGRLPGAKAVAAVKAAHENGGKTGSKGWGYEWSEEVAARVMPSAHGTAHSARQIVGGVDVPGKYFAVARVFRPDVLDASHLIEFNQLEGFVVGADLDFRSLLGMLKDFAVEFAGAEKVKFFPDYFPFTEPSVQLSAYRKDYGWMEFAGAGVFRPEMMLPHGVKEPTIAWGIGLDRLFMFKMGIKDIRYLFSDDLEWLRNAPMVRED